MRDELQPPNSLKLEPSISLSTCQKLFALWPTKQKPAKNRGQKYPSRSITLPATPIPASRLPYFPDHLSRFLIGCFRTLNVQRPLKKKQESKTPTMPRKTAGLDGKGCATLPMSIKQSSNFSFFILLLQG